MSNDFCSYACNLTASDSNKQVLQIRITNNMIEQVLHVIVFIRTLTGVYHTQYDQIPGFPYRITSMYHCDIVFMLKKTIYILKRLFCSITIAIM